VEVKDASRVVMISQPESIAMTIADAAAAWQRRRSNGRRVAGRFAWTEASCWFGAGTIAG
jgi:hypothetical protein